MYLKNWILIWYAEKNICSNCRKFSISYFRPFHFRLSREKITTEGGKLVGGEKEAA
jgi:hypothetical protein